MKIFLTILFLSLIPVRSLTASTMTGISFSHGDWEIACDNTRTCRAAGYQSVSDELALSLLLTRKAGPDKKVEATLMIGDTIDDQLPDAVEMKINDQSYGLIKINANNKTVLSPLQRDALLSYLPKSSQIEFISDEKIWHLSDAGAIAVLLKMDEVQGRLDTPGALVRKGNKDENRALAEIPAPIIVKGPITNSKIQPSFSADAINLIKQAIGSGDCDIEEKNDQPEIEIYPLTDKYLLVSRPCWLAAYNAGSSFWLIKSTPPYDPVFITDSGTDYENGVISESHKGRGLGDCWSYTSYVWDGKSFVLSEVSTTGMCKMVTAGGAWDLPTLVSDVREHPNTIE